MRIKSAFVQHLETLIEGSSLTNLEIAESLGYQNANIISMFKTGATKVPLEMIPRFAACLHTEQNELLDLWLESYRPEWIPIFRARYTMAKTTSF